MKTHAQALRASALRGKGCTGAIDKERGGADESVLKCAENAVVRPTRVAEIVRVDDDGLAGR